MKDTLDELDEKIKIALIRIHEVDDRIRLLSESLDQCEKVREEHQAYLEMLFKLRKELDSGFKKD